MDVQKKKVLSRETFGKERFMVIAGVFNCLIIWSLTCYLLFESFVRIIRDF